jgi:cytochrome P450
MSILFLLFLLYIVAPVTILIVLILWLRKIQRTKIAAVTYAENQKPFDRYVSIWESIKMMRQDKSRHFGLKHLDLAKKYDFKPYMTFTGPLSYIHISTVEDAKRVLLDLKGYEKGRAKTPFMNRFIGDNVAVLNGEDWTRHREIINSAFANVDTFAPVFNQKVIKCLDIIDKASSGNEKTMKVTTNITKLTLDILGAASFGFEFNYMEGASDTKFSNYKYIEAYHYIMKNGHDIFAMIFGEPYAKLPLQKHKKMNQCLDLMNELVYDLIAESKKKWEQSDTPDNLTLMDLMVTSTDAHGSKLSEKELKDNVLLFFLAGHETTATGLCFSLFALASYPEWQQKLRQEIEQVLGSDYKNKTVTKADLEKLEVFQAFHNEVLRLWPPVSILTYRILTKSSETLGDIKIRKGQRVNIHPLNVHRNPEYWDNPEEFNPDRFLKKDKKRPHFAFMPFGLGPRLCIGNNFSLLEQKIFLVHTLLRYDIKMDPNYKMRFGGAGPLLVADPHFQVELTPRE